MNWRSKIDQIWISLRFKLVLISSKWVVTTWFTNMIWHGTTATADIVGRDLGSRSSPGEGGYPRTTQILSLGHVGVPQRPLKGRGGIHCVNKLLKFEVVTFGSEFQAEGPGDVGLPRVGSEPG